MKTDNLHGELYKALFRISPLSRKPGQEAANREMVEYINTRIRVELPSNGLYLLKAGQTADRIYFVEEGMARGYYYDEARQREVTSHLWGKHSVMTVPHSFLQKRPSDLNIEVLLKSRLLSISCPQLREIVKAFPAAAQFSKHLSFQYELYYARRTHEIESYNAWERYQILLLQYPYILLEISHKVIASYLNITPEAFSRLLKKHSHR